MKAELAGQQRSERNAHAHLPLICSAHMIANCIEGQQVAANFSSSLLSQPNPFLVGSIYSTPTICQPLSKAPPWARIVLQQSPTRVIDFRRSQYQQVAMHPPLSNAFSMIDCKGKKEIDSEARLVSA